jgi:hypothetical protein
LAKFCSSPLGWRTKVAAIDILFINGRGRPCGLTEVFEHFYFYAKFEQTFFKLPHLFNIRSLSAILKHQLIRFNLTTSEQYFVNYQNIRYFL